MNDEERLAWAMDAAKQMKAMVDEAVALERERIANLFPRFIHGEMFDATPESDLDLDLTAFEMGERFRHLIGAYPYQEVTHREDTDEQRRP